MTMRSLDAGGEEMSDLNLEAAFRNSSPFDRSSELKRLTVDENLSLLAGTESFENETKAQVKTFTPTAAQLIKPGETIFTYPEES